MKQRLGREWAAVQPIAAHLMRQAGETGEPSLADFTWAHSMFWWAPSDSERVVLQHCGRFNCSIYPSKTQCITSENECCIVANLVRSLKPTASVGYAVFEPFQLPTNRKFSR